MIETAVIQKRVVRALVVAQILGGIGLGATVSVGALLASDVSGSPAWSGMAATMSTLGAALIAVPLARAAQAKGRRVALSIGSIVAALGAVLATCAAALGSFPLLLVGLALAGAGSATNLQARFAATDLAVPLHRARQLSLVVWSTTIGAVLGPNLIEPGEQIGGAIGLPTLTGPFVFTVAAQLAAMLVYYFALQPDPLLTALANAPAREGAPPRHGFATLRVNALARFAVAAVALSHATMVAMMSMTPVHLYGHGATLIIVGFALSLHIAGMYALSPVFGWLADRWGRIPTILFGQGMLVVSLLTAWVGSESQVLVIVSVIFLGLGWSASTIAGSTLVAESAPVDDRAGLQGVSDLLMNSTAAVCGALAGPVLALVGYSGLGIVCLLLVAVVAMWSVRHLSPARQLAN
ncbi:MFS family permease [Cryobacterium mesophilum]|uniref:MFS transporter n=1 Tax=Terrimesophilobacter mesophilus TaxID=433647 RepID=A0A4R8VBX5_9MICO|nr:MFS transporter [Terrimesophilobacter mesophilus]MBB5632512.1 MFS family permease [Terrimesophilobacter mesophilus]TFB79337.1 MFS transporter [Terrimesophilobacter mesophilus]